MFKTWNGHERMMASGGCTLAIRFVRYLFGSCSVLVRSSSVGVRWCPVDPIRDRTSTGHVTDQTEVFRTYAACRTNKTDKERTETDI